MKKKYPLYILFIFSTLVSLQGAAQVTLFYERVDYCKVATNPSPITATPAGGTFSSSSANLVINPTTGEIDLAASVIGGPYRVTYTVGANSDFWDINIKAEPANPTLSYPQAQLCVTAPGGSPRTPTFSPANGTFSIEVAPGLSIASDGTVSFGPSTPEDVYTVTYTIGGDIGCPKSTTFDLTLVRPVPNPTLSYPQNAYCTADPDPSPIFTPNVLPLGATANFSATPAGLSINSSTGVIDLSASNANNYIVTYRVINACGPREATFNITVTDDPAIPNLQYTQSDFCANAPNALPSTATPPGGSFSATPNTLNINASTGEINIAASPVGTYTITYTVGAGACLKTDDFIININPTPVIIDFTYPQNTYCANATDPTPTVNPAGGSFSAPAGLVFANPADGTIDLSASTPGTYTITYILPSPGCPNATRTFDVTISPLPTVPTLSYAQNTYCTTDPDPTPTVNPVGGTFAANPVAGIVIDAATGIIDLSASTPGTYTVTYTVTNTCGSTASIPFTITIVQSPATPTLDYTQPEYCQADPDPTPTTSAVPPGATATFSATPAGLVFANPANGTIDLSASNPGDYTVTYTITAGGCSSSITDMVRVNRTPPAPTVTDGTSCGPGSVTLTASGALAGEEYRWYEGDMTTLIVGQTGNTYTTPVLNVASTDFYVSIINGSCEGPKALVRALINLNPAPLNITGTITNVENCDRKNTGAIDVTISGGTAPYQYSWSNGQTVEDLTDLLPGTYTVMVSDFFTCALPQPVTFTITDESQPITAQITASTTEPIEQGQIVDLTTTITPTSTLDTLFWDPIEGLSDPTSLNTQASPLQTTTYTLVVVNDKGCSDTTQITLEVIPNELFVPNAFSPNKSGNIETETFKVYGNGLSEVQVKITNRLGNIVYETSDLSQAQDIGWDGTYQGKALEPGAYIWFITGKYADGSPISFKGKNSGTVLLLR